MTLSCTRRIEFDAAHRLRDHEGKCKHLHGHRYVIEASFSSEGLDSVGRVVDFGVIRERLGNWVDEHWDHNVILWEKDKALGDSIHAETKQAIFYLPSNPSAENMALYLHTVVCPMLFDELGITCTNLRLYETPNCFVDVK
jgi:6-pyruvoyltetrahydropterin/6-carboxytetrahydropterin synthase